MDTARIAAETGLSVDIGSPKLTLKDRTGVFGWLHYFAAFSPSFVRSAIDFLRLDQNSLILDPFVGIGTTCVVSKCMNMPSVGVELNPVAFFISRAKTNWTVEKDSILATLKILENLPDQKQNPTSNYAAWFVEDDATLERSLSLGSYIVHNLKDKMIDFFVSAILLSLRKIIVSKKELNPTWTPTKHKMPKLTQGSFFDILKQQVMDMQRDLERLQTTYSRSKADSEIFYNDAAEFKYPKGFNAIITSPPYLSRLDYLFSFRLENEFLENINALPSLDLKKLRNKMIGTVTVTDKSPPSPEWGNTCVDLLQEIRNHPSKAAESYYYPTIMRYFKDMFKFLTRARTLLASGGSVILVIQSSYFKEIEIPASSIFIEMALNLGFDSASVIHRENVKFHRGLMDPEQRKYAPKKVLHEDVVWFH